MVKSMLNIKDLFGHFGQKITFFNDKNIKGRK